MHMQDGMLNVATCVATATAAAGAVSWSMRRARREFAERTAPLMGVVAACVFAAQMLNFPIPGATSGHLLGGVLATVLLGPWCGTLVLTVVLAVQCILFQDGGITTLGANVLNLGVFGSLVGYAVFDPLRRLLRGPGGTVAASVLAAWISVVLSATACAVELIVGGNLPAAATLGTVLLFHTMIGIGEALITGLAISFVLRTRPDLIYGQVGRTSVLARTGQLIVAGIAIALVAAVFLSPFASSAPDGLERALAKLGAEPGEPNALVSMLGKLVPMADYAVPGLDNIHLAGSAAGAIGTLVVAAAAFVLGRSARPSTGSLLHSPHAS